LLSYSRKHKNSVLSYVHNLLPVLVLGGIELIFTRSWEGTQPGQLTQTSQRDIRYCTMSCSVYKQGELSGGAAIAAQERTGHWITGVSNGTVHHLLCVFFC